MVYQYPQEQPKVHRVKHTEGYWTKEKRDNAVPASIDSNSTLNENTRFIVEGIPKPQGGSGKSQGSPRENGPPEGSARAYHR